MDELDQRISSVLRDMGISVNAADREAFMQMRLQEPGPSKIIHKRELQTRDDCAVLIPLGDWHNGLRSHNEPKLRRFLDFIAERPNHYTILIGDQLESATRVSVGRGIFEESYHYPDQKKRVVQLLRPLAEQGKILGIHGGNHEERIAIMTGADPAEEIADSLDVPFMGFQGYTAIHVGEQVYEMMSMHGRGNGTTKGGQVNAAERGNKTTLAELYLSGHTHSKHFTEDAYNVFDHRTGTIRTIRRCYVACGSFVEYWGSYAEYSAYQMQPTGAPRIELRADRHDFNVIL